MSQPLELPDPLFDALKRAAEASGTTPIGWIAARLPQNSQGQMTVQTATLADMFRGRVGRVRSSGKEILSECCAEKFGDYVEAKRREGRL